MSEPDCGPNVEEQPADDITTRLNRLYATEESELDPLLRRAQAQSIWNADSEA
jgi:hypothetical protein